MNIEKLILSCLLYDENYIRKTAAFLKPEYFSKDSDKILFKVMQRYLEKYNTPPTKEALAVEIEDLPIPDGVFKSAKERLESLEKSIQEFDWLIDTTEKFCQEKALHNSLMEAIKITDEGGEDGITKGSIPQLLTDALAVSFDTNIGHDF